MASNGFWCIWIWSWIKVDTVPSERGYNIATPSLLVFMNSGGWWQIYICRFGHQFRARPLRLVINAESQRFWTEIFALCLWFLHCHGENRISSFDGCKIQISNWEKLFPLASQICIFGQLSFWPKLENIFGRLSGKMGSNWASFLGWFGTSFSDTF